MRYLEQFVKNDLNEKMVFLSGPRQVGKTTLALSLLDSKKKEHPAYLSWDNIKSKRLLLQGDIPAQQKLIVLDEIHKYTRWRNLVKGLFDTFHPTIKLLVTGSAQLDHYKRGGDSLVGRYHSLRLHPFSIGELKTIKSKIAFKDLLKFGGFPEPLFKQSEVFHRRWQRQRLERVIQDDLRSLERIQEVDHLIMLVEALPERVGSPLSANALAGLLFVTAQTIERWIQILENLYVAFRISPYGEAKIKSVKKEKKLYLWDWSQNQNSGARFENLVACHLLKYCHFIEDTEGHHMELRYLRDSSGREVDFVVLKNRKPLFAIEAKESAKELSPHLLYFKERTTIPVFYQTHFEGPDLVDTKDAVKRLSFKTLSDLLVLP